MCILPCRLITWLIMQLWPIVLSVLNMMRLKRVCLVPGCSSYRSLRNTQLSTDDRRHFFSFPDASSNLARRNAWVLFCSRSDGHGDLLQPFSQPICDLHFQAEDIIKVSQDSKKSKAGNTLNSDGWLMTLFHFWTGLSRLYLVRLFLADLRENRA